MVELSPTFMQLASSKDTDRLFSMLPYNCRLYTSPKEQLFSPEQLTEIFRCCADSVNEDFFELTDKQVELIHSVQQQIEICVPDLDERVRQQEEALERASQEQTM